MSRFRSNGGWVKKTCVEFIRICYNPAGQFKVHHAAWYVTTKGVVFDDPHELYNSPRIVSLLRDSSSTHWHVFNDSSTAESGNCVSAHWRWQLIYELLYEVPSKFTVIWSKLLQAIFSRNYLIPRIHIHLKEVGQSGSSVNVPTSHLWIPMK